MMIDKAQAKPDRTWIKPFARMGYAARGLVYLVIGGFALAAAIGGGQTEDARGALQVLLANPFGNVMAILLVVSLAGYCAWRLVQAIFDTDDHGTSAKGLAIRGGLLASGVTYGLLVAYTISLWRGVASGGESGGGFADLFSGIIGARLAAWLLAAVFVGVAAAHVVKAVKRRYRRYIAIPARLTKLLDPIAMAGLVARGVVFAIIAVLLATRGIAGSDDDEPPGLREALDYIIDLPFGRVLLGVIAVGLIAFALYSLIEAAYRRVNVEDA